MNITFAEPGYLALMLIVPYISLFAMRTRSRKRNRLRRFAERDTSRRLAVEIHHGTRGAKWVLMSLVIIMLSLALAEPHYDQRPVRLKLRDIDLFFVLDISNSMTAKDVPPLKSRLDLAKRKIRSFMDRRPSDKFGLVVFTRSAFKLCPLTSDRKAFDFFLDDVDENTISSGSTDIAEAIRAASGAFNKGPRSEKVIVLISDGEEPEERGDPVAAAKRAADMGMKVFALGVGSEEGVTIDETVPGTDVPAETRADFRKLRSIATAGGGSFTEWTRSNYDVRQLARAISQSVKPSALEVVSQSKQMEFSLFTILPYQIFVFIALLLLCWETFFKN